MAKKTRRARIAKRVEESLSERLKVFDVEEEQEDEEEDTTAYGEDTTTFGEDSEFGDEE